MATYSVSGITLKFWRSVTTYQAEDPVFTEETCTFIIPDYTGICWDNTECCKGKLQPILKL